MPAVDVFAGYKMRAYMILLQAYTPSQHGIIFVRFTQLQAKD